MLFSILLSCALAAPGADKKVYVRFQSGDTVAYGLVEGDKVRQLSGDLFTSPKPTDQTYPLASVKFLVPTRPSKVLALAGNYKSHLVQTQAPSPNPEIFLQAPVLPDCEWRKDRPATRQHQRAFRGGNGADHRQTR